MAEITVNELTDKTTTDEGTGIFDVLMNTTELHLKDQYDEGRITGEEFATVYLGALQSVLAQSVKFTLDKQAADKQAELIDAQINETNEKIDLIIAQTAAAYESIKASQDKTIRENILNNATVEKITEETLLLHAKYLEELAGTIRKDAESEVQIIDTNYSIAIKAQQILSLEEKNGLVITTYTYYVDGISGTTTTTTDLDNVLGPVLSTAINSGTGISVTELDKQILKAKDELIAAQTIGFKSDTKQKVLKQMHDGFAVVLSIAGTGNVPEANQDAAIDQLAQEILTDIGSTVVIQSITQVPDTGSTAPDDPTVP